MTARGAGGILMAVLLLSGCGAEGADRPEPAPDEIAPAPAPAPAVPPADSVPVLADEQLEYATFFVSDLGSAPIRLREGEWTDESSGRAATLTPAPRFRGDLDGDGQPEAAVVLVVTTLNGFESYLVAVGAGAGRATQEAIYDLGSMVTVNRMRVEERVLVIETMRIPGPGQIPSPPSEQRFLLDANGWSRVGS